MLGGICLAIFIEKITFLIEIHFYNVIPIENLFSVLHITYAYILNCHFYTFIVFCFSVIMMELKIKIYLFGRTQVISTSDLRVGPSSSPSVFSAWCRSPRSRTPEKWRAAENKLLLFKMIILMLHQINKKYFSQQASHSSKGCNSFSRPSEEGHFRLPLEEGFTFIYNK